LKLLSGNKLELKPFELMLNQNDIARRINELGKSITKDYVNKTPVLVGVLRGCVVFLADLMRSIKLPLELEFVSAASYRNGKKPENKLIFGSSIAIPLKDRHVLIVEGVVDTGRTVATITKQIKKLEPASLEIVTLIDKPASHRSKLNIKYKGFSIGNEFVIGFGLDNTQKYRNLPFIGKLIDVK